MALKRWGWLWGPVVAALVLAIGLLPPTIPSGEGLLAAFGQPEYGRVYRPGVFREAVDRAVSVQRRRVQDAHFADSLVRAARAASALRSADGRVTLVYERPLTRDSALVWLRAASGELALYPRATTPGLPLVVALLTDSARGGSRPERDMIFPTRVMTSAAAAQGACVVAINLFSPRAKAAWWALVAHDAAGHPVGRFLDVCALYGRFGIPGAAVAKWADRGRNWLWGGYDELGMRLQEAGRPVRRDVLASLIEYSTPWTGAVPWLPIGCLDGASRSCVRAAGLEARPDGLIAFAYPFMLGQSVAFLLARGSPTQFAAFWRSTLPPAQALQAAFGEPAGSLTMSAYRHWFTAPVTGGPRVGARVALAGIGWAAIALALALVAGQRRRSEP